MKKLVPFLGLMLASARLVARADENTAEVEVSSDRDNTVSVGATSAGWQIYQPVCTAPCRATLDRASTYRVAGGSVTPSGLFYVPQGPSPVRLQVEAGSNTARSWGCGLAAGTPAF